MSSASSDLRKQTFAHLANTSARLSQATRQNCTSTSPNPPQCVFKPTPSGTTKPEGQTTTRSWAAIVSKPAANNPSQTPKRQVVSPAGKSTKAIPSPSQSKSHYTSSKPDSLSSKNNGPSWTPTKPPSKNTSKKAIGEVTPNSSKLQSPSLKATSMAKANGHRSIHSTNKPSSIHTFPSTANCRLEWTKRCWADIWDEDRFEEDLDEYRKLPLVKMRWETHKWEGTQWRTPVFMPGYSAWVEKERTGTVS
ncbi:hypothetical protein CC78DRAFT_205010 [Lojkania enalia]|uniref:Uncharacterized protein n=1 Tax=Lojkania enalia TaxID=147567 RepID=A0A9P4N486_9PLEO|nr:hypothetical protein CC78DRAFT_205010 [Didymosphaeria enalia]